MRKMRARLWAVGLGAVCALVCAGSAVAVTVPLTGNPQGVKLAQHVMNAFTKLAAYSYTEHNFFQMSTKTGSSPSFEYRFGYPSLSSGSTWANEAASMAIGGNRVLWWRDDLTPTSKRALPVEIVLNGQGRFWALGNASHHGCFRRLESGSSLPYDLGDRGFSISGWVKRPQDSGTTVELTYVYPWGTSSSAATETDVIDKANDLVRSGRVSVGAYKFTFTSGYPQGLTAPSVKLCK